MTYNHNWIDINISPQSHNGILQMLSSLRASVSPVKVDRIVALLRSIWKTRNNMVLRNGTPIPGNTLIRVKKSKRRMGNRHKLTQTMQPPDLNHSVVNRKKAHWIAWRKPLRGFIKMNFDGSKTPWEAGGDYIIRSWEGRFIKAAAFKLQTTSNLEAEAVAMKNGLKKSSTCRLHWCPHRGR